MPEIALREVITEKPLRALRELILDCWLTFYLSDTFKTDAPSMQVL
ncbi:hypothetical protein [Candidatus Korarchaeum cryptofilum]|nr:hypothetical protein [Candidatus Korarchaeum cryptofilum]